MLLVIVVNQSNFTVCAISFLVLDENKYPPFYKGGICLYKRCFTVLNNYSALAVHPVKLGLKIKNNG